MDTTLARLATCFVLLSAIVCAQCQGGGTARLEQSVPALGHVVETRLVGTPGEDFNLFISPALSALNVPGLGIVCLDLSFILPVFDGVIPPSGTFVSETFVPDAPPWQTIQFFMQGVVSEPAAPLGLQLTNTLRKQFAPAESWETGLSLPMEVMLPRANLLAERGWVLLTGGQVFPSLQQPNLVALGIPQRKTSVYLPLARTFIPGPNLIHRRVLHTATTMQDGRILIVGGVETLVHDATTTCEIFDPATLSFQLTASLNVPRAGHNAVLLSDGRVLVAGGSTGATGAEFVAADNATDTAEVFDPVQGTWTSVAGSMQDKRIYADAALLPDGRVLVTGGYFQASQTILPPLNQADATDSCDFYDPSTNAFSPAPSLPIPRARHRVTSVPGTGVLLTGGRSGDLTLANALPLNTTLIFDGQGWLPGPPMSVGRSFHEQVLLQNGKVLITGGSALCEVFDGSSITLTGSLPKNRHGAVLTLLNNGTLLSGGGMSSAPLINFVDGTAEIYTPDP